MISRIFPLFQALVLLATLLLSANSFAATTPYTVTFCPEWWYSYSDTNAGGDPAGSVAVEDQLLNNSTSAPTTGHRPVSYSYAKLYKGTSTTPLFENYLNSSGCFPAQSLETGVRYNFKIYTYIQKPGSTTIDVRRTQTGNWEIFTTWYQFDQSPGANVTVNSPWLGPVGDPVVNAMAVMAQFAQEGDIGLGPNYHIVFADDDTEVAYADDHRVFLGHDPPATPGGLPGPKDANRKYIIAHEFGHTLAYYLFGDTLTSAYTADWPSQSLCKCDQVPIPSDCTPRTQTTPANPPDCDAIRLHCLQSREAGGSAQNEGWGQFIGVDLMNIDGESDARFTYYKHSFRPTGSAVVKAPPFPFDARAQHKWMENKCDPGATTYRGSEIDWMGFYYAVHSTGTSSQKYNISQIQSVYLQSCGGGTCAGKNAPWANLRSAANSVFGSGSARALYWDNRGVAYGVDH